MRGFNRLTMLDQYYFSKTLQAVTMFLVGIGRQEYNKNATASINAFHMNLCQIVDETVGKNACMSPRILFFFHKHASL